MIINLKTKSLYTDKGEFLKKVECPNDVSEQDLIDSKTNLKIKNCTHCDKGIYKTDNLTDEELKELVRNDPNICFYIKYGQKNISRIEAGELLFFKNMQGASTIKCIDCSFETKSIIIDLRAESNEPCQCQECGEIYKNLIDVTCTHKNVASSLPIFCKLCSSFNVIVNKLILG